VAGRDDFARAAVQLRVFIPDGPDPEIEAIHPAGSFQGWDFDGGLPLQRDDSDARRP
jgi:hypothetical protein